MDPGTIQVLTADREFISARWLKRLKEAGIPFAVRLRADRKAADAPGKGAISVEMYARSVDPGDERVLDDERYLSGDEGRVTTDVRVAIRRLGGQDTGDPFLILAT